MQSCHMQLSQLWQRKATMRSWLPAECCTRSFEQKGSMEALAIFCSENERGSWFLYVQSEELGRHFRTVMYPRYGPAGGGLLRLHSTYRHDLKIYSSDEGRVQMSAAAFTQGLLDLEGHSLTPILVRCADHLWQAHWTGDQAVKCAP